MIHCHEENVLTCDVRLSEYLDIADTSSPWTRNQCCSSTHTEPIRCSADYTLSLAVLDKRPLKQTRHKTEVPKSIVPEA
jgi:hypothetical protein